MNKYDEINSTDLAKSQAILLYILRKTNGTFGHMKMMKTILLTDQKIFRDCYQSFSGYQYHKDEWGPYSKSFQRDLDILLEKGFISANVKKKEHPFHTYNFLLEGELQSSYFFPPNEQCVLDDAIKEIEPLTAEEASERTHDRIYEKLERGENIPLYAYLEPNIPTKEQLEKAKELFNAD